MHRYINLFNQLYEKRKNKAYFETISQGFLYILPDINTYIDISEAIPPHDIIGKILQQHKEEKENFYNEFTSDLGFSPDTHIQFTFEIINYDSNKILPPMKKIFKSISPDIRFSSVVNGKFTIDFPNLDIFADYLVLFMFQLRNVN